MKTTRKPYFIIYILIFAAILIVDQVIKWIVITRMELGQAIPSIDSFFSIHFVVNDGVAFSLLKGHPEILIVMQSVIFIVITVVLIMSYIKRLSPILLVALTWIIAGGAGNLIDRVRFHYVIDYISVGSFPIWNFADMAVVGGCILVAIFILFVYKIEEPEDTEESETQADNLEVPDEIETVDAIAVDADADVATETNLDGEADV